MAWPKNKPCFDGYFKQRRQSKLGSAGEIKPDHIGRCRECRQPIKYGSGWVLKPENGQSQLYCSTCG